MGNLDEWFLHPLLGCSRPANVAWAILVVSLICSVEMHNGTS